MSRHLQEFITAKPLIDFLIALLTLDVFSGTLRNRLKIIFLTISNVLFIFLLFFHVKNTIRSEINTNFMWTFLLWNNISVFLIVMILNAFKRNKFHLLMQSIQKLFEEEKEDEELDEILQKNLEYSMKVFNFLNRWIIHIGLGLAIMGGINFRLNRNFGLIIEFPYFESDNFLWRESQYILQTAFGFVTSYTVMSISVGFIFLGLLVMAEINILTDYMKLLNEKIKTDPKFLSKMIKRHCSVIENLNLLSDILSDTSFLHLFASCATFMFGFSFIMKYPEEFLNYLLILAATMLSLHICILGEFIGLKSENLSETLYLINWYELSLKDQKSFLIILGMAQREYGLKAAGMYDVNLYTFVQISKIAFSYCAILYSLSQ
uniref:Odorant receptor n=1 Tax=Lutzomyia longipalpis TaxID=7200 RepID=A0A240SXT8_LUTLO